MLQSVVALQSAINASNSKFGEDKQTKYSKMRNIKTASDVERALHTLHPACLSFYLLGLLAAIWFAYQCMHSVPQIYRWLVNL
jgi:hypothetical protein